jgi:DnaJ-class molecular chaperone
MTEDEEIQLTLDIQPGMSHGDTIKFDQVADEAVGHIPGDLIFHIHQIADSIFSRQGDDLSMNMVITLEESLLGFRREFFHVDGHKVVVNKDTISYCAEVIRVEREGMPKKGKKGQFGDLFITLVIDFPGRFNDKQKALIKQAMALGD